jgi:hypothetical protein
MDNRLWTIDQPSFVVQEVSFGEGLKSILQSASLPMCHGESRSKRETIRNAGGTTPILHPIVEVPLS